MLALGIDTSTSQPVGSITDGTGWGHGSRSSGQNRHVESLAPLVRGLFEGAGRDVSELTAIGVGLGPGPFTGLRVGIAHAAAMGHALGIPVYGFCSLDAVAAHSRGSAVVMTDARRKEVYWARYNSSGERVDGPHVTKPADLVLAPGERIAGPGAELYREVFAGQELLEAPHPDPGWLAEQALLLLRAGAEPTPLTPLYLRRPDAEESFTPKSVLT